jgi:class 3 adenylate cyclase
MVAARHTPPGPSISAPGGGQDGTPMQPGEEQAAQPLASSARELEEVLELRRKGVPFLLYRDALGKQCIRVLDGDRPLTMGRGSEVDVCLAWDQSVSLVHAEAVRMGAHWLIGDDGVSRNGTFVNGERLNGRRRLRNGDVIRIGRTALTFDDARAEGRGATTISDARSSTGTVTLLFTDLVGSTELIDRLGDQAGDRLLRDHFAILREAAAEHGGREVKSLGDGLMLAFASALGAVACAVRMQRRIAAYAEQAGGEAVALRIGLNAGEAISAEGDYFGTTVVVAKRLCDRAGRGQILVSDVVRSLVDRSGEHRFIALGALQLKGLAEPITAFGLEWHSPEPVHAHG